MEIVMRYPSQIRCLFFIFSVLFTTGCAHKKLIDAAQDYAHQGRYEQAVEQYQKALDLKPNDNATQQKLADAQQKVDIWLDGIDAQAQTAKVQQLNGRALLLFAKVVQLRNDTNALAQYKKLHWQLTSQHRYKIQVDAPTTLGKNLAHQLDDIQVIDKADKSYANQFTVKVSHGKPAFVTKVKEIEKVQQYVSGVTSVPNPDYLHLQDDITNEREHIHQLSMQLEDRQITLDDLDRQVHLFEKDLEIAQLKAQRATPNSHEYQRLQQDINHYQQELNQVQHYFDKELNAHEKVSYKLHESKDALHKHLNELSYLPPTVEQDVLSDHFYPADEVTRTATAKVTIAFNQQPEKSKTVSASFTDTEHDEQPRIKLPYNPLELINDKQLSKQYYAKARQEVEQAIEDNASTYRHQLKNKANQMPGIDQKLEAWVNYGVASSKGVDDSTDRQMSYQLEQEFGVTGIFEVNTLLHLFKY
jgi:tetratricopeptide (TPR) repeat protein